AFAFTSQEEKNRIVPQFERYIELYFSNGGVKMLEPDGVLGEIARERIRADPWQWVTLRTRGTARMLGQYYFSTRWLANEAVWDVTAWFVGVLAVMGAVISLWRKWWQPLALVFLYTWWIHFPTHGEPRYLAPAYGAAMLLAALALYEAAKWVRRSYLE